MPQPIRMTAAEFQRQFGRVDAARMSDAPAATKSTGTGIRLAKAPKMNKGELAYHRLLQSEFPGREIRFEGISFRLTSGTRYTPDFTVWNGAELLLVVEVKGSFRLGSADRSALAFKETAAAWPFIRFRHASRAGSEWRTTETGAGL